MKKKKSIKKNTKQSENLDAATVEKLGRLMRKSVKMWEELKARQGILYD